MKQLLLGCAIAVLGVVLTAQDADAKRLGGGKKFGRSAPSSLQQKQQRQQAAPSRQQQPAANSGARRWLGPLAGLAAGGLLAAMLFGDGFEGLQIFDILLVLGLIFGAFWLFKQMRRGATAGAGMHRQAAAVSGGGNAQFGSSAVDSGEVSGASSHSSQQHFIDDGSVLLEGRDRPAWFNEQDFLQAAKTHFVRLQAAWDKGDMQDIRDYTTPELFAQLTLDRQSYKDGNHFTEVVSLDAELLGLSQDQNQVIASVRYSGMIREQQGEDAQPFTEVWHIQRDPESSNADWFIAGIEQEE